MHERTAPRLRATLVISLALVVAFVGASSQPALANGRCSTSAGAVESRVAAFWQCVNALGPSDQLTAEDLGQWARNVTERDSGAGIRVDDFRTATAGMQAALDRASVGIPSQSPKTSDVEQRISSFWQRVNTLGPADLLTAADLGQWALNVIDRDPSKRIRVDDFRTSTAGMQGALDRARALPRPTPTVPPAPTAGGVTVTDVRWPSCTTSANPLPGWINCPGTVTLSITSTISSGFVSVGFNYPDDGSFFHGQLQVGSGIPGTVTVNVVNDYESHCATSFATTVDVHDGTFSGPLLVSQPVTLTSACGVATPAVPSTPGTTSPVTSQQVLSASGVLNFATQRQGLSCVWQKAVSVRIQFAVRSTGQDALGTARLVGTESTTSNSADCILNSVSFDRTFNLAVAGGAVSFGGYLATFPSGNAYNAAFRGNYDGSAITGTLTITYGGFDGSGQGSISITAR